MHKGLTPVEQTNRIADDVPHAFERGGIGGPGFAERLCVLANPGPVLSGESGSVSIAGLFESRRSG
jgi:hypothetical protein